MKILEITLVVTGVLVYILVALISIGTVGGMLVGGVGEMIIREIKRRRGVGYGPITFDEILLHAVELLILVFLISFFIVTSYWLCTKSPFSLVYPH